MAYIIVVQPAVLSGKMFGTDTGLDFGAVTTATSVSAALGRRSWLLSFSLLIAMIGAYRPITAPP